MDSRLISIYLLLEKLGGFDIDDIDKRIFSQKAIYLLQLLHKDLDLGYRYNWYLKGPYSPDLTQSLFQIDDSVKERAKDFDLRDEVLVAVEQMKNLVSDPPAGITQSGWVELISSIHFLKWVAKVELSKENTLGHLKDYGKLDFSEVQVSEAWEQLFRLGLNARSVAYER